MYVTAVASSVTLHFYRRNYFYNNFKIEHTLCITSRSAPSAHKENILGAQPASSVLNAVNVRSLFNRHVCVKVI
jgi:hypothetical protein